LTASLFEPVFVAAFPGLFLVILVAGEAALRRRKIDMQGAPPIDKNLFYLSKLAMVIPWAAMFLQSLGVRLSLSAVPQALKWISLALWASGFSLAMAGRFGLGSSFRVGCAKEKTILRTDGIFRLSRNPIYVGLNATLLASALYTLNPVVLVVGVAVSAVHHRIILAEEACLRRTFGEEYEEYCRRVGRYI
jgi:protein-S-isoprenylcysteine O-methyltransferase Ste14